MSQDAAGKARRLALLKADPNHPKHGRPAAYNDGCRCEVCTTAHRARMYRLKAERVKRTPPESVHGTAGGYNNWGCRCPACTEAWAESCRSYRHRVRKRR